MLEVLSTGGRAGLSDDRLLELYRLMRRVRALDQEAINLQRQGELTAYAPLTGQEACQVAAPTPWSRATSPSPPTASWESPSPGASTWPPTCSPTAASGTAGCTTRWRRR